MFTQWLIAPHNSKHREYKSVTAIQLEASHVLSLLQTQDMHANQTAALCIEQVWSRHKGQEPAFEDMQQANPSLCIM